MGIEFILKEQLYMKIIDVKIIDVKVFSKNSKT